MGRREVAPRKEPVSWDNVAHQRTYPIESMPILMTRTVQLELCGRNNRFSLEATSVSDNRWTRISRMQYTCDNNSERRATDECRVW